MHHADLDCDVSTGLRFHPVEVVLSMLLKLGAVRIEGR
jgi:sterol desaturase/sphingolipid hydroxylase (fatty acid hydroxylase superfamily)